MSWNNVSLSTRCKQILLKETLWTVPLAWTFQTRFYFSIWTSILLSKVQTVNTTMSAVSNLPLMRPSSANKFLSCPKKQEFCEAAGYLYQMIYSVSWAAQQGRTVQLHQEWRFLVSPLIHPECCKMQIIEYQVLSNWFGHLSSSVSQCVYLWAFTVCEHCWQPVCKAIKHEMFQYEKIINRAESVIV